MQKSAGAGRGRALLGMSNIIQYSGATAFW